jgi:hypothetical protein
MNEGKQLLQTKSTGIDLAIRYKEFCDNRMSSSVCTMADAGSPLRHYILNTSFHGFRFIGDAGLHWTER